jgi:hypothetical protein
MQTHKSKRLAGPLSGSRPWWRLPDSPASTSTNNKKETMFRAALVEQIRHEIAQGTYDTPEKWEAALDRLCDRLDAEDA